MTGRLPRTADAILAVLSQTPGEWVPGFRIGVLLYTRGIDVRIETRRRVLRQLTEGGQVQTRLMVNRGTRLEHRVLEPVPPRPVPAPVPLPVPPTEAPIRPTSRYAVIRWQSPPPPRAESRSGPYSSRSRFDALADELRDRPGAWAVIYEGLRDEAMGLASGIRRGTTKCWQPVGSFQATARSEYGKHVVYVRYVG